MTTSENTAAISGRADATRVAIGTAGVAARLRDPVRVLVLDLLTLGIYGGVWYYRVNREMATLGRARGTTELGRNPTNSLLALFPGFLLIVPTIVSLINTVKRVRAGQRLSGIPEAQHVSIPLGFVLLLLIPPVGSWYCQKALNQVWRNQMDEGIAKPLPA